MELLLIAITGLVLLGIALVFYKINALSQKPKDDTAMQLMQQQMEGFRNQFVIQLGQITEQVNKLYADNQNTFQKVNSDINNRLDNAAKVIGDVHRKLGEVHETSKRVQEVGQDIASLQEILRAPKIRGGMGELFLSDLLKQVLPPSKYKLQYYFKSREAVDAVILLRENMVPVDSKFPLENFKKILEADEENKKIAAKKLFIRDVKKHIDAISKKYILPDEGTFDFALMYIPAENVYYETIIKDENLDEGKGLFQYAIEKKVLPVSPNSFYAYLQTILLGLRGMKIEAQAQDILKNLARLAGDFSRITDDFSKMGTHLKNLNASYENTDKRLGKFGDRLTSLEEKDSQPLIPNP
ncbi:DNA recombination protein RmuC [Candidatus Margulisiibacteriota bacterium]